MSKRHQRLIVSLLAGYVVVMVCGVAGAETPAERDARMQWWREARFGMFIHWGIYAQAAGVWNDKEVPGVGEWIMHHGHIPVKDYETIAPQFNPVKFNAAKWVAIAKNAGMKYIIITSKHHDGFCMFDSKLTDYDIVDATPFKRDPLKELAAECKKQGVRLGFYYSIMDWHHPDANKENFPKYVEHMKGQIRELLTNYGDIGVMWFDGEWIDEWTEDQGRDLYAFCRSLQPKVIVNNRVGKGRDGMRGLSKSESAVGDFGTPEQEVPSSGFDGVDWETCMTMNDTWGFKKNEENWKSPANLIQRLIDIASKGGNYLLNVGPDAKGEIPEASVNRLHAMGDWMRVNGVSIYRTTAGPLGEQPWGRSTRKDDTTFVHVFDWPKNGTLTIPAPAAGVSNAVVLGGPVIGVTFERRDMEMVINLPPKPIDPVASVIMLQGGPASSPPTRVPELGALTPAEFASGWKYLFDGRSTDSWRGYKQTGFPAKQWVIEDGTLKCLGSVEGEDSTVDLVSREQYGDFELTLEFKTTPHANSGIMYRVTEKHDAAWQTGPEFQVLEDAGAKAKPTDPHSCGAMYDLYPPVEGKVLKPAGEFNQARIRVKDNRVEHWLNNVKVVDCEISGDVWTQRIAASKFKDYAGFGVQARGHIALQNHGDVVWYRDIRVRSLNAPMPGETPLFDGKTMKGWTHFVQPEAKMEDVWRVENGIIICKGDPAGYIRTENDYTNFVLKIEWRFSPITKQAGNSGVLVRMVGPDKIWPKSVEAQLMSENAGDFFSIENFPLKGDPARSKGRHVDQIRKAERPVGEWNEYEIIVDRDRITLRVNGDTLNEATGMEEVPGKICLQSEGAEIHFRKIRLAPIERPTALPANAPKPPGGGD